jgi:hypothetical protein
LMVNPRIIPMDIKTKRKKRKEEYTSKRLN